MPAPPLRLRGDLLGQVAAYLLASATAFAGREAAKRAAAVGCYALAGELFLMAAWHAEL